MNRWRLEVDERVGESLSRGHGSNGQHDSTQSKPSCFQPRGHRSSFLASSKPKKRGKCERGDWRADEKRFTSKPTQLNFVQKSTYAIYPSCNGFAWHCGF